MFQTDGHLLALYCGGGLIGQDLVGEKTLEIVSRIGDHAFSSGSLCAVSESSIHQNPLVKKYVVQNQMFRRVVGVVRGG